MKTLDEVIFEAPYTPTPWEVDALSYLKEYKELSKMWNDRLDKENSNSALTWEQLKQMEGKPVWVKYCNGVSRWEIVCQFGTLQNQDNYFFTHIGIESDNTHKQSEQGQRWQAYRKERE